MDFHAGAKTARQMLGRAAPSGGGQAYLCSSVGLLARPKEKPKTKNDNLPCANAANFFLVRRVPHGGFIKGRDSQNPQFCRQDRKRFLVFTLRDSQRDVVYLGLPIAPLSMSEWIKEKETECRGCGLSMGVYSCAHWSLINL